MNFFDEKEILKLINAQEKEIEVFIAKLKSEIERELNRIAKGLSTEQGLLDFKAQLAKLSTTNLPKKLQQRLDDIIYLYQSRVDTIAKTMQFVGIEVVYAEKDIEIINQIITTDRAVQLTTIEQTFNEFKQVLVRGNISGKLPDIAELSTKLSEQTSNKMTNDVRTQLAGFQTAVTKIKAEDHGIEYFRYSGSLIKTSREFCRRRAGKIYSFKDLNSWDNGQGLPANPYLGGYNCRHAIIPISARRAKEEGISNDV